MKIYVWEKCFTDYTSGLLVVVAKNLDEAMQIGRDKIGYTHEDLAQPPKVFTTKEANGWFVHGGG